MTTRSRVGLLLIAGLGLLVAIPYGVLRYRVAKSAAFCDAVEALPRTELEQFASRCDRLLVERGGSEAKLQLISDPNTLAQFVLAGRRPYEIVLGKGTVGIKYIKGNWRYSTLAIWDEDWSASGEAMRVLKITYGTYGWRVLCRRQIPSNRRAALRDYVKP
jgi:hypothetical protein